MTDYSVYCNITDKSWMASFIYNDEHIFIDGDHCNPDKNRNELQATLEILQFLRNWINNNEASFNIYINSQYSISCLEKWIPNWIQKGFRINHTANLRPNTDLLVKLHSFRSCMNINLTQHYNDYETYCRYFNM